MRVTEVQEGRATVDLTERNIGMMREDNKVSGMASKLPSVTAAHASTPHTRGAIIVALGSPTELSQEAIAEFLGEFLSDQRVVDLPSVIWQPILRGPLLHRRPAEVREQYEHIWMPGGSPLRVHTQAQTAALAHALPDVDVRYAYQYGDPNFVEVFTDMARTCESIAVLTTYPQFAPATSGSVADRLSIAIEHARAEGNTPRVRASRCWPTLPSYISWHADAIESTLSHSPVDALVFSWHGLPARAAHQHEEYRRQCSLTTEAIIRTLSDRGYNLPYRETFQSKFGPGKWMEPATIDVMETLPDLGVRNVLLITPGFLADCLETSYEMDVLNAEVFYKAGGERFLRIAPPQGEDAAHIFAQLYQRLSS